MTSHSANKTVNEGSDLTLFCNATGKPAPNITWTRVSEDEVLFVGNPWHIVNINRTYSRTYRCIADNGVPSSVNSAISVNVLCEYTLYYQLSSILFNLPDLCDLTVFAGKFLWNTLKYFFQCF